MLILCFFMKMCVLKSHKPKKVVFEIISIVVCGSLQFEQGHYFNQILLSGHILNIFHLLIFFFFFPPKFGL